MRSITFLVFLVVVLTGCKLVIIVPEGGSVASGSGEEDCAESASCVIEVNAADFQDIFIAIPASGYKFVQWSHDSVCADRQNPVCPTSNVEYAGIPDAMAAINSDAEFYLRPIFTPVSTAAGPKRIVRDADGDFVGEVIDITAVNEARVVRPFTDPAGSLHHFLFRVTPDSLLPVGTLGEQLDIRHGDASCDPDDVWTIMSTIGPIEPTLGPYFDTNLRVARMVTSSLEEVWSVVQLVAQASAFNAYTLLTSGDCLPAGAPLPMRRVEVVAEDWLGDLSPPYSMVEE